MPGNQFGVLHKGMYHESKKSGASSMKSGGMKYGGQSGTVTSKGGSGGMSTPQANMHYPMVGGIAQPKANMHYPMTGSMPTPKANVQHNAHGGGKKY